MAEWQNGDGFLRPQNKLKCEYRAVKDHTGRSGADRKYWKCFEDMEAIYCEGLAGNKREWPRNQRQHRQL